MSIADSLYSQLDDYAFPSLSSVIHLWFHIRPASMIAIESLPNPKAILSRVILYAAEREEGEEEEEGIIYNENSLCSVRNFVSIKRQRTEQPFCEESSFLCVLCASSSLSVST